MFFRKQLWRAVTVSFAVSVSSGALFVAPAQASADKEKKPKTAAAKVAKPAPRSAAKAAGKSPSPSSQRGKAASMAAAAVGGAAAVSTLKANAKPLPSDAESRLLGVIQQIERQQLDAALQAAAKLTADVPNFQAAQLVYADLLRFKTGKPGALAATTNAAAISPLLSSASGKPGGAPGEVLVKYSAPTAAGTTPTDTGAQDWQAQLHGLKDELKRRVHGASALPPVGSVPREFLQLSPNVQHALAIDASKSRLYLFTNEGGKLRLTADYYISVGKLGMGKKLEGDQRTPEGVYFIGRQIPGVKLPDFYGKGALTFNYPNDWDRSVGRSGDGIWLHGSPPDQFARLPEASDGCVVLANPDLISLMKTVDRQTPVLIRDKMQWVPQSEQAKAHTADTFAKAMNTWQQAWRSADQTTLTKLYAPEPIIENTAKPRLGEYFQFPDTALQDVSIYTWKDPKGEIRIVDLQVGGKRISKPLPVRQYWRRAGDRWEIFSEEIRG